MISLSCFPPFLAFCTGWFPPTDHFEIHCDSLESELTSRRFCFWRFLVLLTLSHKVFWVRCGTYFIDSWHLPSSLHFILTRVPTHKKYRILCYHLRSNSCWLPIRCAYFILVHTRADGREHPNFTIGLENLVFAVSVRELVKGIS